MNLFDRYLLKNLIVATIFVSLTLTGVIFLTQSLRFLELVIDSGASAAAFWMLTMLALPRFFEIILPIALMAAIIFVYNKLIADSEIIVMRATGTMPLQLARPALVLAVAATVILWFMTMWLGPSTLSNMQQMRQMIKAQYSGLLFREGVFNSLAPGLTVYVRSKDSAQELSGIMIHDTRPVNETPVTITAKRGIIGVTDEGQQVVVYDGARQSLNSESGALEKLDFERYTIDLPDGSGPVRQRWREPDERTIIELLNPDLENSRDVEAQRDFMIDIHRRVVSPLLALTFSFMALAFLLTGQISRRGQTWRIAMAVMAAISLQGLYLAAFNLSLDHNAGLVLMYLIVFLPLLLCAFLLSPFAERFCYKAFFERIHRTRQGQAELP